MSKEPSDEAKNATIDRADFDAALKKLIQAKPTSTDAISRKVKLRGRARSSSISAKRLDPR